MNRISFGADGVRGVAGQWPITPKGAERLGLAYGSLLIKQYPELNTPLAIIGRDTRPSGEVLSSHLSKGLLKAGVSVIDLGIIPTPCLSYLTRHKGACGSIMVSASHNPARYNGFKIFNEDGLRFLLEHELEGVFLNYEPVETKHVSSKATSKLVPVQEFLDWYVDQQIELFGDSSLQTLGNAKLLIDCANGSVSKVTSQIFSRLGAKITTINDKVDSVINDKCGSEYVRDDPTAFANIIQDYAADYGLAFDGDGDRLVIVDCYGNLFNGEDFLFILARYFLTHGEKYKPVVVTTKMANMGLESALGKIGITLVRTDHGDKNLEQALWNNNYLLAAEPVGNVIINDGSHAAADPLYAALLILGLAHKIGCPMTQLLKGFERTPQKQIRISVPKSAMPQVLRALEEKKDKTLRSLSEGARVLIWASSTEENVLKILVEGSQEDSYEDVVREATRLRETAIQIFQN